MINYPDKPNTISPYRMIDLLYWLFKIIKFVSNWRYRVRYSSMCGSKDCARCGRRPLQYEIRLALLFFHWFNFKAAKKSRLWEANPNGMWGFLQYGTILDIPGIKSRPVNKLDITHQDFYYMKYKEMESTLVWNEVEKSAGSWKIAKIIDQGQCAENFDGSLVSHLAEFVPSNILFNASFSKLTVDLSKIGEEDEELIAIHFGCTTAKSRVHIPIEIDEEIIDNVEILAGGHSMTWKTAFDLDDSYAHLVRYRPKPGMLKKGIFSRTVLIFDRWQPDLTHIERDEINFVAEKLLC